MSVTLFHFQGSPNCAVADLALARKGLSARKLELPIGLHPAILRGLGFRRGTVPAARVDGRRVQGSTAIMRALDELVPEPRLFPDDAVAELARWGEEYVQTVPRRMAAKLIRRAPRHARSFTPSGLVGRLPRSVVAATVRPTMRFQIWRLRAGGDTELHDALRELEPLLQRLDALLADGSLTATAPTAADLQIAPQIRMLMCFADLRPAIEAHPRVAEWLLALVPEFPGHLPPVLMSAERELLGR